MKTTLSRGRAGRAARARMATIGETMGASDGMRSGWYLRTYDTTAGQGVAM
jgi:hypothetical protein